MERTLKEWAWNPPKPTLETSQGRPLRGYSEAGRSQAGVSAAVAGPSQPSPPPHLPQHRPLRHVGPWPRGRGRRFWTAPLMHNLTCPAPCSCPRSRPHLLHPTAPHHTHHSAPIFQGRGSCIHPQPVFLQPLWGLSTVCAGPVPACVSTPHTPRTLHDVHIHNQPVLSTPVLCSVPSVTAAHRSPRLQAPGIWGGLLPRRSQAPSPGGGKANPCLGDGAWLSLGSDLGPNGR